MSIEMAIQDVAIALGIDVDSLFKLISFESGWNPQARNPYSSARGLIQFTDATAKELGFLDSADLVKKYPDIENQLRGPVLKYLLKYKPFGQPFPQSLYMAVFYPAYRHVSPDTLFSDSIRTLNPGINTVKDYVDKVEKKKSRLIFIGKYSAFGFFLPVLAAAGAVFYNHFKRRQENGERGKD